MKPWTWRTLEFHDIPDSYEAKEDYRWAKSFLPLRRESIGDQRGLNILSDSLSEDLSYFEIIVPRG